MSNPNVNPKVQLVKAIVGLDLLVVGLLAILLWVFSSFTRVGFGFYLCVAAFVLLAVGLFFSPNSTGSITPNPRTPGMQFTQSAFSRQYHAPFNTWYGWLPGEMFRIAAFWSACSLLVCGALLIYFGFP
jgi:hypothetical protein